MSDSGGPPPPDWWVPPTQPAPPGPPPPSPPFPGPPPPVPPVYSPYVTYGYGGPPPTGSRTNGLAIASLVLGIISVVGFLFCFGIFTGVPGLVMGIVALGQINRSQGFQGGRGMAIAGIVTSAIGLVVFALTLAAGAASSP